VNYDYRTFLKEALMVYCLGGIVVILLVEDVCVVSYKQMITVCGGGGMLNVKYKTYNYEDSLGTEILIGESTGNFLKGPSYMPH
jgi:hypothetical protein